MKISKKPTTHDLDINHFLAMRRTLNLKPALKVGQQWTDGTYQFLIIGINKTDKTVNCILTSQPRGHSDAIEYTYPQIGRLTTRDIYPLRNAYFTFEDLPKICMYVGRMNHRAVKFFKRMHRNGVYKEHLLPNMKFNEGMSYQREKMISTEMDIVTRNYTMETLRKVGY